MNSPENAADHLRIIRQLMERATVYRAISAPTALGGGIAAIALAIWQQTKDVTWQAFLTTWLSLFLLLSFLNLFLLWTDSRKRGTPFFSSGMKLALRSLTPPLLAGGITGIITTISTHSAQLSAALWAIFYGLALLSTSHFAPKSIKRLGFFMCYAGLTAFVLIHFSQPNILHSAPLMMGATFGLAHTVYGLSVLLANASTHPHD